MQEQVSLAKRLADAAGAVISGYFRQPFDVDTKADATPVTIADKGAEAAMRKIIEEMRPDDGIYGEEFGIKESKNGYTWVLDPIDGTKSFTIGRPIFGTLIALCKDDVPILGVIDQCILKERWVGDGKTTTFNGKQVKTRICPNLKSARVSSTSPAQIPHLWERIYKDCAYMAWGGDCYSYAMVANGGLDCIIETGMQPYDYAAVVPVVTGAGGWIGDWEGNPLTLKSKGHVLAVGDPARKDDFIKFVS